MTDINLIPIEYRKRGIDLGGIFSKAMWIVLVLVILSLLIYGGLLIYRKSLTTKITDLNEAIAQLEAKRDKSLEASIVGADKKLGVVENLFENHFYWSKLFAKIEELVVADVSFSEMKTSLVDAKMNLTLSGNAKSYTGLAEQMVSFKEDKLFESVELTSLKSSESGGLDFTLSILVSESILMTQAENKQ